MRKEAPKYQSYKGRFFFGGGSRFFGLGVNILARLNYQSRMIGMMQHMMVLAGLGHITLLTSAGRRYYSQLPMFALLKHFGISV